MTLKLMTDQLRVYALPTNHAAPLCYLYDINCLLTPFSYISETLN